MLFQQIKEICDDIWLFFYDLKLAIEEIFKEWWVVYTFGFALLVSFIGYLMNFVSIFHTSFDPLTGTAILKIVGVFVPPLGVLMGLFF